MNQDFNSELIDSICSGCDDEDLRFLFSVWHKDTVRRFCPTCVLISQRESFCPNCFAIHNRLFPADTICCYQCHSYSHVNCLSSNSRPSRESPLVCASCRNPDKLNFTLIEVEARGQICAIMDKNAAELLFTAAKIATLSLDRAIEATERSSDVIGNKRVTAREKATGALIRLLEHEQKKNKCYSELQSSGEAMDFDLNEEYPSWDDNF